MSQTDIVQAVNVFPFQPCTYYDERYIRAIKDVRIVALGEAQYTNYAYSEITPYTRFRSIQYVDGGRNFIFHSVIKHRCWVTTFFVASTLRGIQYIRAVNNPHSFLLLDATYYNTVDDVTGTPNWLLEPCRTSWLGLGLKSITLINTARNSDGSVGNSTTLTQITPGTVFALYDGYNCSLSYNENTSTLHITGGVGTGKGLAPETPWDDITVVENEGIVSINGLTGPDVTLSGIVDVWFNPVASNEHALTLLVQE